MSDPQLAPRQFLVRAGQAQGAIVIGQQADEFDRWVAAEVQRYIQALSGGTLPVVTPQALPGQGPLLVLGGPQANGLAAAAEREAGVRFAGLQPDGFVVSTVALAGRTALVAGGNEQAASMYAAYELLERLGLVFQLTNDIIPRHQPDLALPVLDLRLEPAFRDRGMHCWHGIRWYMGLDQLCQEIDQLAKLKMNVFQFYWGMGGPWAPFVCSGQPAALSGLAESGFVAWPGASGTAAGVTEGRHCFPADGYLGPPEFADVRTPEAAVARAREFLRQVIRHAHARRVKVWLAMGEVPYVPANLAPAQARQGREFYCGVPLSPGEPVVLEAWQAALASMIETYPEADRYWVVSGSELLGGTEPVHGIGADDPGIQTLIRDYEHLRPLLPAKSAEATARGLADLDLADIAIADQLVRRTRARYPQARLGIELIFRGGQLRALDAALPQDVALMNMVNFTGETAMDYFAGIHGRDRVVWPRITDDGFELNVQLNASMYDHDRTIAGGVEHGLSGILGQLNKARGAEQSAAYVAEGAWDPAIQSASFYERYLRRLYGPEALADLLPAFLALEANEQALGWRGRRGLFSTWCATSAFGVSLRRVDYRVWPLALDHEELARAIDLARTDQAFWRERQAQCADVLTRLRRARARVWPGALAELDYLIDKTEGLVTAFALLHARRQAEGAFDEALLAWTAAGTAAPTVDGEAASRAVAWAAVDDRLAACETALRQAREHLVTSARLLTRHADVPTERHILWILNRSFPSHDAAQRYLDEVRTWRLANGST